MFKKIATVAALALFAGATPVAAVTSDAFTSFNGTQGAGGFSYGSYGAAGFTAFTNTSNCAIAGSVCLQSNANDVPGAYKSTTTSFQYNSVNVPDDRLLLHPGNGDDAVYISFTAPTTSVYRFEAQFDLVDIHPSGVGLSVFVDFDSFGSVVLPLTIIDGAAPSVDLGSFYFQLDAGDSLGFIIDKDGSYNNDSTGVNFSASAVPEPATWSLMIGGFALVGLGLRRRSALAAA